MKSQYQITGFMMYKEEDFFEHGCQPNSGSDNYYDYTLTGSSPQDIALGISSHLDTKIENMTFNACHENGRIDITRMENSDGEKATKSDLIEWEKGLKPLWHTVYTTHLELCTTVQWPDIITDQIQH